MIAARVCRYAEKTSSGSPAHLEISEGRKKTHAAAERLAAPFRQLSDKAEGEVECQSGINEWYLVSFFYRGQAAVDLHVSLVGCGLVENSVDPTGFYPSSSLERTLERAAEATR